MNWLRRLGRNRLLDVGAAVIAGWAVVRLVMVLLGPADRDDFAHYYVAGCLFNAGRDPYVVLDPVAAEFGVKFSEHLPVHVAPNPPPFLWMISPFARLPLRAAYAAWMGLSLLALVVVVTVSCRLLEDRWSRRGRYFFVMGVLAAAPVYWHFMYGQVGLILAALVLVGYAWHRRGWAGAGCVAVATAGLLKIFPWVLLPWFVWRGPGRWQRAMVTGAFIVGVSWASGWDLWVSFRQQSLPLVAEQSLNQSFNYTVPSFVMNLQLAATQQTWLMLGSATGLVLLAGVYAFCWWRDGDREVEFALLCLVMLIASIRSWGHYLVMLIFPIAVALESVRGRPTVPRVLWVGCAVALVNVTGTMTSPWLDQHLVVKVLVNYFPLYGLVLLGGLLVSELSRNGSASGSKSQMCRSE
ncbi:MAG: hypothetical protein PCFJNLEI_02308 [Verrucomicrobiae bacterium]|nr:hypothetical protein [Verrucomicrobiae bacterium]